MSEHKPTRHPGSPSPETVIRVSREPVLGFLMDHTIETRVVTNVPVTVVHHSPTGFEFGYGGSGPADLALNTLNWLIPPGSDQEPAVQCWKGSCSQTAWRYHQRLKEEWVARLSRDDGGEILASEVLRRVALWRGDD